MIRTITTAAGVNKVEFSVFWRYFWVRNIGNTELYVSARCTIAPNADCTAKLNAGECVRVDNWDDNNVYILGAGKVEIHAEDFPDCPFKIGVKGGGTVENAQAANTVEYPVIGLNIYGASTQEGTPTPDAPAEIISVGDDGTINVEIESGMIGNAAEITSGLPLCGIDDVCDELIYNADGTGKVIKRFGRVIVSAANVTGMTPHAGFGNYFSTNIVGAVVDDSSDAKPISNRFVGVKFADRAIPDTINMFRCFLSQDGRLILRNSAADNRFTTVAEMQDFVTANETIIVYPLAAATEIELTAAEMAALQQLQTFDGATTVSNNENAEMIVKCCTNPMLSEYVYPLIKRLTDENAELKAAVLSLGGNV